MKIRCLIGTLVSISLLGCGGGSGGSTTTESEVAQEIEDSINTEEISEEEIIYNCDAEIEEEIKLRGNGFTIKTHDNCSGQLKLATV